MRAAGYLVERYANMGGAYTCSRLVEEAATRDILLSVIGVNDIVLSDGILLLHGAELPRRDFALMRYKWGHLKDRAADLALRTYNELGAFSRFVDKFEQRSGLALSSCQMPRWALVSAGASFDDVCSVVGLPFVAKGLESSQGLQVHLVSNRSDFRRLLSNYGPDKELLVEEFISSSCGTDLRLFSVRGEAVACMRRTAHSGFRANFALGASIEAFPVNGDLRSIAREVYGQSGLDIVGIDLLTDDGDLLLCEVNVMPGIEGMERATGINVARKIIDVIEGDLR